MTAEALQINEFLQLSKDKLVIDVRSPIEYFKGHIPGAINIALFEDMERAEIGTLYKQKGKEEAVLRGFEIVSPKLADFIRKTKEQTPSKEVFVYCFRGGMRSNSFGWLLNTGGLNARILKGGYKAYRHHILKQFEEPKKLILLGGATGSGKTDVLQLLKKEIQVVDLEAIANHKGSAFGSIGQKPQLPQQLFEHYLHNAFEEQDPEKIILLEDESMAIGYNKIPYTLWLQMKAAPIIKLKVPFELRVNRLVNDYGKAPVESLKKSVMNISSQIGPDNTTKCMKMLDEGNMADVARITLTYYDKAYEFNYSKKEKGKVTEVECETNDLGASARKIRTIIDDHAKY